MKKIFLLVLFTFTLFYSKAGNYTNVYFMNCNGVRTEIGRSNQQKNNIPCFNICKNCKLELAVWYGSGWLNLNTYMGFKLDNNSIPNVVFNLTDGSSIGSQATVVFDNNFSGDIDPLHRSYISLDLSDIPDYSSLSGFDISIRTFLPNTNIEATDIARHYGQNGCLKVIPANNLDNISFDVPNEVCLGKCVNFTFTNYDVDIEDLDITWGSQSRTCWRATPGGNPSKVDISTEDYCFNELGLITVTANIKDACGTKTISKKIEVKDCDKLCKDCCDLILSSEGTVKDGDDIKNLPGCRGTKVTVYYSDGTSEVLSPPYIVNKGKKVKSFSLFNSDCKCGYSQLFDNINPIGCEKDCDKCCIILNNYLKNFSKIANILNGNLILPENLCSCGEFIIDIYFSDGTSISTSNYTGTGINLGGKIMTSLCIYPKNGGCKCGSCIMTP